MTNNQRPGAMPRTQLLLRSESEMSMEEVKRLRDELLKMSNDLLCMLDEENWMELRSAGRNIYMVIDEVLDRLSDEGVDTNDELARDFQLLAEKYGFEKKGEKK